MTTSTTERTNGRSRSRKLKAILAGGLVLGLGAAITLAVWNDSEFATGTFTAGHFNMEGSLNGTTYSQHASSGAAAVLSFTANPTNMSPGDVEYAPFAVRLDATTTYSALVTVTMATTTGTLTDLTYTIIEPTAFGCDGTTTGTTLVAAGTALSTVPGSTTFNLSEGTPPTTAGAPMFLCFKVTAGSGLAPGQTGSATWQFAGASQ